MSEKKNVDLQEKEVNEVPETEAPTENKVEEVKEETKEEVKVETANEVDANVQAQEEAPFLDLPKPDFDDCEAFVKNLKADFDKSLAKDRKKSMITIVCVLVAFVVIFACSFVMPKGYEWVTTMLFAIVIVGVIVYLVFLFRGRKELDKVVQKFLKDFIYGVDAFAFATNDKLSDVKASKSNKISIDEIVDAHYFDVINAFNTRNVVKANFLDREMRCGELAVRVPVVKEVKLDEEGNPIQEPVNPKAPTETYGIFGKYFTFDLKCEKEESFIIYMEGPNVYKPTFLDGYEGVTVDGLRSDFHVYAIDASKAKKNLNNIKYILNEFQADDVMENLFVSYNDKGLKICLNYNETLMEVPLRSDVKNRPYSHFKDDVNGVLGICECLTKGIALKVEREIKPEVKEEPKADEVKEEVSEVTETPAEEKKDEE